MDEYVRYSLLLVRDRPQGFYVMTMTATDHDDPRTPNAKLTYGIIRNKYLNNTPVFRIEHNTGKLFAMVKGTCACDMVHVFKGIIFVRRSNWIERILLRSSSRSK